MVYAGIASLIYNIRILKEDQNLGSPLFNNIRQGNWLLDYIVGRFRDNEKTLFIAERIDDLFSKVKKLPNHAKPHYF